MILARQPDTATVWLLAFQRQSQHWWLRWLPGEFKHVAAFAWVPAMQTWVIYDVSLDRTTITLLPGDKAAQNWIAAHTFGGAILKLAVQKGRAPRFRIGFWCVPAIKHLLGLRSGALLPTALWRDCLRAGAEIIDYGKPLAPKVQQDPALVAAQQQQSALVAQQQTQATAADAKTIQSSLGDATTNLARMFGANTFGGGVSPLVGGAATK